MELTAQCDLMNIQVRRKKVHKGQKKSTNPGDESTTGIFGTSLEVLLARDRQITGDNQLEVPIIFEKVTRLFFLRALYPTFIMSDKPCEEVLAFLIPSHLQLYV